MTKSDTLTEQIIEHDGERLDHTKPFEFPLQGIKLIPSDLVQRGVVVRYEDAVVGHPVDLFAMLTPNPHELLVHVRNYHVLVANQKFARLQRRLAEGSL